MTLSFALPNASDAQTPTPGLEGGRGRKNLGSAGGDGFADLVNDLEMLAPLGKIAANKAEVELGVRQTGNLPTGKSLPVGLQDLPQTTPGDPEDEGADVPQGAPVSMLPLAPPMLATGPVPLAEAAVTGTVKSAIAHTAEPTVSRLSTSADMVRAEQGQTGPTARGQSDAATEATSAGEARTKGLSVSIAAATTPREVGGAAMSPSLQNGMARIDLPTAGTATAPSADGGTRSKTPASPLMSMREGPAVGALPPSAAKPAAKSAPPGGPDLASKRRDPQTTQAQPSAPVMRPAAPIDQPAHTKAVETGSIEIARNAQDDKMSADKPVLASRASLTVDTAKAMPQTLVSPVENPSAALRPMTVAPRPVVSDPFADVERVVEHIMAARQVDLAKPAAIAVAHREFGALTVTFDQSANGMNVEIAAESSEAQRALAAAIANDRTTHRQQDPATQANTIQNQSAATGSDRGGSAGHTGSGPGQSNADDQRSAHSDQRGRHGERGPSPDQPSSQTPSDDALYV